MKQWNVIVFVALLGACSSGNNDDSAANNSNAANNANNTVAQNNENNTAAQNNENNTVAQNNENNTTAQNNTTSTNNRPANNTTSNNQSGLILPCEDLIFNDSCLDPMAATGYPACSDFFGDSTSQPTCGLADPMAVFSDSPCPDFEHYVGSCVYYTEALPNACYITHVGAETADAVQAGRDFWSNPAVCANWVEGP